MIDLTPRDHYEFLVDHLRNEETLLAQRFGWFLAAQGFCFTAYAITQTKDPTVTIEVLQVVLTGLGIFAAYQFRFPLRAALLTLDLLLKKQEQFFQMNESFQVLRLAERAPKVHRESWRFVSAMPACIMTIWIIALAAELWPSIVKLSLN